MTSEEALEFTSGRRPISQLPAGVRGITLTRGFITIVNAERYDELNKYSWCAWTDPVSGLTYAQRGRSRRARDGHDPGVYLHRAILEARHGERVDHVDHNTLNNLDLNLRPCTQSENGRNSTKRAAASSKYKGVSFHKGTGRWRAYLHDGPKNKKGYASVRHLGLWDSEEDAARARDDAVRRAFGQFATLNFPLPHERSVMPCSAQR